MVETVSRSAIIGMVVSLLISVAFPIALLVYWKIKQKTKFLSFVIGAATFILFALVLEQLFHTVVMLGIGKGDILAGSDRLSSNVLIYGLYGGICAAVFEETGRFLAMKLCMKNFLDKKNAIMYGIGHGGIEAIIIVGIAEISNIATSIAINTGALDTILEAVPQDQRQAMYDQVSALWTTPASDFYLAGIERITAILLHICLSYMVYRFVKYNEKQSIVVALAMHFIVDFATVVLISVVSTAVVEAVLVAIVVVFFWFVVKKYRNTEERELTA